MSEGGAARLEPASASDERSTVVDVDIVVNDEVEVRMRKPLVPARSQSWLQATVLLTTLPILSLAPRTRGLSGKGCPRPRHGLDRKLSERNRHVDLRACSRIGTYFQICCTRATSVCDLRGRRAQSPWAGTLETGKGRRQVERESSQPEASAELVDTARCSKTITNSNWFSHVLSSATKRGDSRLSVRTPSATVCLWPLSTKLVDIGSASSAEGTRDAMLTLSSSP